MLKVNYALAVPALALALSACGGGGFLNRERPDEFAVSRATPLVIPPDFALTPPKPGAPRPLEVDSQGQALRALFGDFLAIAAGWLVLGAIIFYPSFQLGAILICAAFLGIRSFISHARESRRGIALRSDERKKHAS